jgi:hypothetical protein
MMWCVKYQDCISWSNANLSSPCTLPSYTFPLAFSSSYLLGSVNYATFILYDIYKVSCIMSQNRTLLKRTVLKPSTSIRYQSKLTYLPLPWRTSPCFHNELVPMIVFLTVLCNSFESSRVIQVLPGVPATAVWAELSQDIDQFSRSKPVYKIKIGSRSIVTALPKLLRCIVLKILHGMMVYSSSHDHCVWRCTKYDDRA